MRKPLLFIADGIPKLDEETRKIFPRADFQLCTIHASRNLESDVRESDKNEIDRDLKAVFLSETKDSAIERFNRFKENGPPSIQGLYTILKGSLDISSHTSGILTA